MSGHRYMPVALPGDQFDGRPDWHERANCRGMGTDLFFNPARFEEAARVCAGCPVAERCEEQRKREMFGMWAAQPAAVKRRNGYTPRGAKPIAPCGTDAAYNRHLRRGETPCPACREAHNRKASAADRRRRRARSVA